MYYFTYKLLLFDNMTRCPGFDTWWQNIQIIHTVLVRNRVILNNFHGFQLFKTCFLKYFVVTFIGIDFGAMMSGAILTETVFNWPGVGNEIFNAVSRRDWPVVMGGVAVIVVLVMVDEPHGAIYGGSVAAPVFQRVVQRALRYLNVPPEDPEAVLLVSAAVGGAGG